MEYSPRLKSKYKDEIIQSLIKEYNYSTVMQVPRLLKISLNQGLGKLALNDKKVIDKGVEEMSVIAGQKAVATKSKKDISNFKLRKGMPVGVRVTLRGDKMYEFLDRLISITLPRVRDFEGVSPKGFDGRGNYSMGLKEQLIFPEINYDDVDTVKGMNVVFTTTAKTDEEAQALLELLGMPFEK